MVKTLAMQAWGTCLCLNPKHSGIQAWVHVPVFSAFGSEQGVEGGGSRISMVS